MSSTYSRSIAVVFKTIIISLLLMVASDTIYMIYDGANVYRRVDALAVTMQNQLAQNNSIPNSLSPLFQAQLQNIVDRSDIATNIRSNLTGSLTNKHGTFESIAESNVKDYGQSLTLALSIDLRPHSFFMVSGDRSSGLISGNFFTFSFDQEYQVPALRYLK